MNLNDFELDLVKRDSIGSSSSRALRNSGKVPVAIYGKGKESISAYVEYDVLNRALNTRTLFNKFTTLNIGKEKVLVFAKIVQKHPVTDKLIHIDFQIVDKNAQVKMKIPVIFMNKELCEAIKLGGLLNVVSSFIEISGPAALMPESLIVDLKTAQVGNSIRVEHLNINKSLTVAKKFESKVVATILAAKKKGGDAQDATAENAEAPAK